MQCINEFTGTRLVLRYLVSYQNTRNSERYKNTQGIQVQNTNNKNLDIRNEQLAKTCMRNV